MTTILVVEDEAIVAMDIAQRLSRAGCDVPAVTATGEVALRTLEELHPDLVLMDILLKGEKNGIETAREIKDQFEIPVIFLTGQADESTQSRSEHGRLRLHTEADRSSFTLTNVELALARHAFEVRLKESENRFRAATAAAADRSHGHAGHRDLLERGCKKPSDGHSMYHGPVGHGDPSRSRQSWLLRDAFHAGTRETYVPPSSTLWRRKTVPRFLQSQASPRGKRKGHVRNSNSPRYLRAKSDYRSGERGSCLLIQSRTRLSMSTRRAHTSSIVEGRNYRFSLPSIFLCRGGTVPDN